MYIRLCMNEMNDNNKDNDKDNDNDIDKKDESVHYIFTTLYIRYPSHLLGIKE